MTSKTTLPSALASEMIHAAADDGLNVQLLVHRPTKPRGWLVWAHGGSWQYGSALGWASVTQALASASGWAVVSVDYRLAPAHQFPAAVLDVLTALDWTERRAADLPVAVGGDSAGGTLAALSAIARRDAGHRVPAQVLAYPPMDPDCARASYGAIPGALPAAVDLRAAWRIWLGSPSPDSSIHSTPLRARSLVGLAPVSLTVGENDPVRDDVTAYADQLQADGVDTTLQVLPGVGHADLLNRHGLILPAVVAAFSGLAEGARLETPTKGTLS